MNSLPCNRIDITGPIALSFINHFCQHAVVSFEEMMSEASAQYNRRQRIAVIVGHLRMAEPPLSCTLVLMQPNFESQLLVVVQEPFVMRRRFVAAQLPFLKILSTP